MNRKQPKGRRVYSPQGQEEMNPCSRDEGDRERTNVTSSGDSSDNNNTNNQLTSKRPPETGGSMQGNPKKRRKNKKSQDGKPVRPLSAYNAFFRDERISWLAEQNRADRQVSQADSGEEKKANKFLVMGKEIGARWRALTPQQREKYVDIAAEDMKRYRAEMEEYNDKMVRDTVIGRKALEGRTIGSPPKAPVTLPNGVQRQQQAVPVVVKEQSSNPTSEEAFAVRESTARAQVSSLEVSNTAAAPSFPVEASNDAGQRFLIEQILRMTQKNGNSQNNNTVSVERNEQQLNRDQPLNGPPSAQLIQQLLQAQLLGNQRQQPPVAPASAFPSSAFSAYPHPVASQPASALSGLPEPLQQLLQAQLMARRSPSPQAAAASSLLNGGGALSMGDSSLRGAPDALIRQLLQAQAAEGQQRQSQQSAPLPFASSSSGTGDSQAAMVREQLIQHILQQQASAKQQQPIQQQAPVSNNTHSGAGISEISQILALLQKAEQDKQRRTVQQPPPPPAPQTVQQLMSFLQRQQQDSNNSLNLNSFLGAQQQSNNSQQASLLNLQNFVASSPNSTGQSLSLQDNSSKSEDSRRQDLQNLLRQQNLSTNSKSEDSNRQDIQDLLRQQSLSLAGSSNNNTSEDSRRQEIQDLLRRQSLSLAGNNNNNTSEDSRRQEIQDLLRQQSLTLAANNTNKSDDSRRQDIQDLLRQQSLSLAANNNTSEDSRRQDILQQQQVFDNFQPPAEMSRLQQLQLLLQQELERKARS